MLTIGHSTLPMEAFLRALVENGVQTVVDVRRFPGSRRHPQFGQEALFRSLAAARIQGVWREDLGGRRVARVDSCNRGWTNESFRGYADYMQTPEFTRAADWLEHRARNEQVVVMCAEAVPWRCHRSLIADALLAREVEVEDVLVAPSGANHRKAHAMTAFARRDGTRVWYPREGQLFD